MPWHTENHCHRILQILLIQHEKLFSHYTTFIIASGFKISYNVYLPSLPNTQQGMESAGSLVFSDGMRDLTGDDGLLQIFNDGSFHSETIIIFQLFLKVILQD